MHDASAFGTARKMIELYGGQAQSEAKRRCERALAREDALGFERWTAIAGMIGGLRINRDAIARAGRTPLRS